MPAEDHAWLHPLLAPQLFDDQRGGGWPQEGVPPADVERGVAAGDGRA